MTEATAPRAPRVLLRAVYDGRVGLPTAAVTPLGALDIVADVLGRMSHQRLRLVGDVPRQTVSRLSPAGRHLQVSGADGVTRKHEFDACGRLSRVRDPDVDVQLDYDVLSRLATRRTRALATGSTLVESFTYDALGQLTELIIDTGLYEATRVLRYSWRPDGKVARREWESAARHLLRRDLFRYDVRGRLVDHEIAAADDAELPQEPGGRTYVAQRFAYDAIDNLIESTTTRPDGTAVQTSFEYDHVDVDRVLRMRQSDPEGWSARNISYDANGNITDDGSGRRVAWDQLGRLDSVESAHAHSDYAHGPEGVINRVSRNGRTTFRFHEGSAVSFEASDDEGRRYLRVQDTVVAETRLAGGVRDTWILGADAQGSVVTDLGAYARTRVYGAYGWRETCENEPRSGFAGGVSEEEAGWYVMGQRVYDAGLQRFLGPDRASPFDSGGMNRYAYCGGDPINRTDPDGESWMDFAVAIISIVAAAYGLYIVGAVWLAGYGAAVTGSLAASTTTPTVITHAAGAVLEVTGITSSAGDLYYLAKGNEDLADAFGALNFMTIGGAIALTKYTRSVLKKAVAARKAIEDHRSAYVGRAADRWVQLIRAGRRAQAGRRTSLEMGEFRPLVPEPNTRLDAPRSRTFRVFVDDKGRIRRGYHGKSRPFPWGRGSREPMPTNRMANLTFDPPSQHPATPTPATPGMNAMEAAPPRVTASGSNEAHAASSSMPTTPASNGTTHASQRDERGLTESSTARRQMLLPPALSAMLNLRAGGARL